MPDWPCPGARRSNPSNVAAYSSQRPPHSIAQMRDVMGRRQALIVIIVRTAPANKLVRGGALDRCRQRVAAAQHEHIAGTDEGVDTAAGETRAAFEYRDPRRLIRTAAVDVVDTGLQQPHAAAWHVDFRRLILVQLPQVQID